ncbi:hypothetical protein GENT5_11830 [Flavobacterium ammoniigenes]|uniref:Yip1 domain-containing protein n=2 Tax=Flavobacterium ammoniigenes TaxID=1751095 RepID=A0ABN6L217_9FLAO|nr:hypothetical protein GENT5_11830 [Flavobacterium ammoniigenes]
MILIAEITKNVLNFNKLIQISLAENLTNQQIEFFFNQQSKWHWFSIVFTPIYILIKTNLIASILYIGTYFYSKTEVKYKLLWDIAVKAEFLFLIALICKIIWFYFFQTNYTLKDVQYFYPFSVINFLDYNEIDSWFIYPLQTLNLFEFGYWILLSYFISKLVQSNKTDQNKYPIDFGLIIVSTSYGISLFLWVIIIMFFTLNFS